MSFYVYLGGICPGVQVATHSSILAWKMPWTEESGGLQSMGLQGVRQDGATERTYIASYLSIHHIA